MSIRSSDYIFVLIQFNYKAAYEERLLGERYDGYADYKTKVGRFGPKLNRTAQA